MSKQKFIYWMLLVPFIFAFTGIGGIVGLFMSGIFYINNPFILAVIFYVAVRPAINLITAGLLMGSGANLDIKFFLLSILSLAGAVVYSFVLLISIVINILFYTWLASKSEKPSKILAYTIVVLDLLAAIFIVYAMYAL